MKITNLYRYHGDGGTVDTPVLLPMEYELRKRLEADDGMVLTDGELTATVIDIPADEIIRWTEIPAPEAEDGEAE